MSPLLFHHGLDLAHCRPGGASGRANPKGSTWAAYMWLAERCGFWPTFVAVGQRLHARELTGYCPEFATTHSELCNYSTDPYTRVMFSWPDITDRRVVLNDYIEWIDVLNRSNPAPYVIPSDERIAPLAQAVLKPGWTRARWLAYAHGRPVQAVVPGLDLSTATEIRCWLPDIRDELIARGFSSARIVVMGAYSPAARERPARSAAA